MYIKKNTVNVAIWRLRDFDRARMLNYAIELVDYLKRFDPSGGFQLFFEYIIDDTLQPLPAWEWA